MKVSINYQTANEFMDLYEGFNKMVSRLDGLIEKVYVQEILTKKMELKQLQAQIIPHFLYNSYFILHRMIKERDFENATNLSMYMGKHFQYITRNALDEVFLYKEVEQVKNYVEIQILRFTGRLEIEFGQLEEKFNEIMVPRMVEYPGDRVVILMQQRTDGDDSNKSDDYYITYTKGVLELVQKSLEENLKLSSSFVISSTFIEFEHLFKRFQQILQVLAYHGAGEKGVIITDTLLEGHMNRSLEELNNKLLQFINEYIEKNIMGDVSLIKLSEVTGYNPSYLSRLYKEIANETLNEYIGRVRFKKAKELLESSNLNLNAIAVEIGLESRTYFNRFIKKITGMSPQEYRDHLNECKHRIQK